MYQYHALVIGNSEYVQQDRFPPLPHAIKDANDIFEQLTSSPAGLFSEETSRKRTNLSIEEMRGLLAEFFQQVEMHDLVLIYFSGHADVIGKSLFLIMTNTDPCIVSGSGFDVSALVPYFDEKCVNRYIVVLDCCRAGAALDSPGVRGRGVDVEPNLGSLTGSGKVFVTSARAHQRATELDDLHHGLFTHYFLYGIRTGECVPPSKPHIDIASLYYFVHKQMMDKHPEVRQEPTWSGQDQTGQLIVANNVRYKPEEEHRFAIDTFIDTSKRLLTERDTRREGVVVRQKVAQLREFLGALPTQGVEFKLLSPAAVTHAKVLGLEDAIASWVLDTHTAGLRFKASWVGEEELGTLNGKGRAFLFSTAFEAGAYESSELKSSVFAHYLREALCGLGANERGYVTLESACRYVARTVSNYEVSEEKLVPQRPVIVADMPLDPVLTIEGFDWHKCPGRRVAVLIAVDKYLSHNFHPLSYAERDARLLGDVLVRLGGFECVTVLGSDATYQNVVRTLSSYTEQLADQDLLLFVFFGHGFAFQEDGYAALYNAKITENGTVAPAMSVTELSALFSSSRVGAAVGIFDACMIPVEPNRLLRSLRSTDHDHDGAICQDGEP